MANARAQTVSADPRVLFIARARIHRDAFMSVLEPEVRLRAASASPEDVFEQHRNVDADVVIVDAAEADAAETLGRVVHAMEDVPVIAIGVPPNESTVVACAEAGASALVAEDATATEVIDTVRSIAHARRRDATLVAEILLRRLRLSAQELAGPRGQTLTAREIDVLELVANGLANKEIAAVLSLSVPTVKNHVQSILKKLGVRRRSAAAQWLRRQRLSGGSA